MSTLEIAIGLAVDAHRGQFDKAGKPYILHPLRLMQQSDDESLQIVAVLHDVIEDTWVTRAELERLGFAGPLIDAVESLTKIEGEAYADFIARAKANPLARKVKELDLLDNMNCARLLTFTDADAVRMKKYTAALLQIRAAS
jgi:(p)ppGpp synthase/HD superfamily hydrolase